MVANIECGNYSVYKTSIKPFHRPLKGSVNSLKRSHGMSLSVVVCCAVLVTANDRNLACKGREVAEKGMSSTGVTDTLHWTSVVLKV